MSHKNMTKLDNLTVIFSCIFTGSCFTATPIKNYNLNDSFKCVLNEKKLLHKDHEIQDLWAKNYYKEPKFLGLNTTEKVYDLSLKCEE